MDFMIAVHAITLLFHKRQQLSSRQIAENVCANPVQIRRILAQCVKAGLVQHTHGVNGGYSINTEEPPTLLNIARALQIDFLKHNWDTGDPEMPCLVSSGMSDFATKLHDELEKKVEQVLNGIAVDDVENQLIDIHATKCEHCDAVVDAENSGE